MDVSLRNTIAQWVLQVYWAGISARRVRREPALDPFIFRHVRAQAPSRGQGVWHGYGQTARGPPGGGDPIFRFLRGVIRKTVLAIFENDGVEIHQMGQSLGNPICHAADGNAGKAMAHENDVVQLFSQYELDKIINEGVQSDGLVKQVRTVAHASEAGREYLMPGFA